MSDELDLANVSLPDAGVTPSPPPEGFAWRVSEFENAIVAADKAYQYDQDIYARRNALSDAIDRRNWDIQRATGASLENPWNGGYEAEAREKLYKSGQPGTIWETREQIWRERLGELQTQYPDHADKIGADRPVLEDAKQLADYWTDRAARGQPGLNAAAGLAASFLGGLRGFLRNPLNIALLPIGGGEVKAASVAGKIAEGFLREAAVNAGQQALGEPVVQAWRAERGRESGVLPALEDIGVAALFGGTVGAGFQGAKVAAGAALAKRASAGERVALAELPATGVAERAPAVRSLSEALDADEAAFAGAPVGVKGLDTTVAQAFDHAEGLNDALPEIMRAAEDEFPAREALAAGANPQESAARLARIDAKARELSPKKFAQADELDARIAGFYDEMNRAAADLETVSRARDLLGEAEGLRQDRRALRGAPNAVVRRRQIDEAIAELRGEPALQSTAGQLQSKIAALEAEIEGITGKRRSSPRAKALAQELQDVRAQHEMLISAASARLRNTVETLRLNLVASQNDRALLGPKLFAVRKHAASQLGETFEDRPVGDVFAAAAHLRTSPRLTAAAVSSDAPDVVAAGRLASLGDAAFDAARNGEVSQEVALATASRVSDEGEQLSVMRAAQDFLPARSAPGRPLAEEAGEAVSREMQSRALPQAQGAILEAAPSAAIPDAPGFDRVGQRLQEHTAQLERELIAKAPSQDFASPSGQEASIAQPGEAIKPRRTVTREFPTLFETLASEGGLAPHPELKAIFDGNPFVPGFGRLVREGGRSLDQALQAAKDLGYMFDAADQGAGELNLAVNDLLDLLRREAHGEKVHSFADLQEMAARDAARAGRDFERARAKAEKRLRADKAVDFDATWPPDNDVLAKAALILAEDDALTPPQAWKQAMEDYRREAQARFEQFDELHQGRYDETGPIPGFDEPAAAADGGATPRPGGEGARAGEGQARAGGGAGSARAGAGADRAAYGPTGEIAIERGDGTVEFVSREKLLAPDNGEEIAGLIEQCRD
jgi:hypothetical protein